MNMPICAIHPNEKANYVCNFCGFLCHLEDENNPTHIAYPITPTTIQIWNALQQEKYLPDLLQIKAQIEKAKAQALKSLEAAEINISKAIKNAREDIRYLDYEGIAREKTKLGIIFANLKEPPKKVDISGYAGEVKSSATQINKVAGSFLNLYQIANEKEHLMNEAKFAFENGTKCKSDDIAILYFKETLNVHMSLSDCRNIKVADTFFNLGMRFFNMNDFQNSYDSFINALKLKVQLLGSENNEVAIIINQLGIVCVTIQKFPDAIKFFGQAAKIYERIYGSDSNQITDTYCNIGNVLGILNSFDQALEFLNMALKNNIKHKGENSEEVAGTHISIGVTYVQMKSFDKAIISYQAALNIYLTLYGKHHGKVADIFNNLGLVNQSMKKSETALDNYREALQINIKLFTEESTKVAIVYINMGDSSDSIQMYDDALKFYAAALKIIENNQGVSKKDSADIQLKMGTILLLQSKYSLAIESYEKALKIYQVSNDKKSKIMASIYNNIAIAYCGLENNEKAAPNFNESLTILIDIMGTDNEEVADRYSLFRWLL